jgi:hypothetical protein
MQTLIWSGVEELRQWLTAVAIPTHTWGQNGTKTVATLWQELIAGETVLQTDPPQRQVQLVEIVIRRSDQVLIEAAQELAGGQMRQRDILPAEKMKAGEGVETAVLRGLQEELGVAPENVTIQANSYRQHQRLHDSPSYPGLPTLYTIHRLTVRVNGLPDSDFWHDHAAYGSGDPVKRHYWTWRSEITD